MTRISSKGWSLTGLFSLHQHYESNCIPDFAEQGPLQVFLNRAFAQPNLQQTSIEGCTRHRAEKVLVQPDTCSKGRQVIQLHNTASWNAAYFVHQGHELLKRNLDCSEFRGTIVVGQAAQQILQILLCRDIT